MVEFIVQERLEHSKELWRDLKKFEIISEAIEFCEANAKEKALRLSLELEAWTWKHDN